MRRLFRPCLLAVTVCVEACASGASSATPSNRVFADDQTIVRSSVDTRGREAYIDLPLDRVWTAALAAYRELGFDLTVVDSKSHQIGVVNAVRTRVLADQPLTRFFDCGGSFSGPRAASDRLLVTASTVMSTDEKGRTVVRTSVAATSTSSSGGGAHDSLPCATTGSLEARINNLLTTRAVQQ
ncbi:MAG: hypothetical protein ABJD07_06500 [Gemmatimonadaceae bacterium]